ncbi:hypothetical protein D3C81_1716640 [compost metagenome]
MVAMYRGMVNSSTLTAAWAMARTAAVSVASMSSGRLLMAGWVLPKTGIFILSLHRKDAFRISGRTAPSACAVHGKEIIRLGKILLRQDLCADQGAIQTALHRENRRFQLSFDDN